MRFALRDPDGDLFGWSGVAGKMRYSFIPAILIFGLLANGAAVAQDSRYSNSWSNPDRPAAAFPAQRRSPVVDKLLKELQKIEAL